MNRLILIGNGFDKAHDLATSYPEFMDWYWDKWQERLAYSGRNFENDELCSFKLTDGPGLWSMAFVNYFGIDVWSYSGIGLKNFLNSDIMQAEKWKSFRIFAYAVMPSKNSPSLNEFRNHL